jgi:hypothetical protein
LNFAGTGFIYSAVVGEYSYDSIQTPLAIDATGNAYVAGCATNGPTTSDAFQPAIPGAGTGASSGCVHIAKLNPAGSALLWGTYYGGTGSLGSSPERTSALAVDSAGNIYIAGNSRSTNLPVTSNALKKAKSVVDNDMFLAKISEGGGGCTFTLEKTAVSVPGGGGVFAVGVNTAPGCVWTGFSGLDSPFVTPGSQSSAVGSGTAYFVVSPNDTSFPRSGSVTIANQSVNISQNAGICEVFLQAHLTVLSSIAQSSTVPIFAPFGCSGPVTAGASWITPANTTASGRGVFFTVQGNSGSQRIGSISVAGQTFTVIQNGPGPQPGCSYVISAIVQTVGIAPSVIVGGPAGNSVDLFTSPGCAWTAQSNAPWITLTGPTSGTGPAVVSYMVDSTAASARSGTVTIAGEILIVSQPGSNCSVYSTDWSITNIPAAGSKGSALVKPDGAPCA